MTESFRGPEEAQERTGRRKPFASWVKKLTNFKNNSSAEGGRHIRGNHKNGKKRPSKNNNPYPESGQVAAIRRSQTSLSTGNTDRSSLMHSRDSMRSSTDGAPPTAGGMSMAPTVSTDQEASHSIHAPSHMAPSVAGTSRTANGGMDSRKGGDSTFSSPAPSVRSLTTTLTTIQSMGPNGVLNGNTTGGQASSAGNNQAIQFSQPFPTTSPASALPAHLIPGNTNHPVTYNSATANNLLTDNASLLTLASSSKRRRRRSFDTDASVRAMAPSSLWGGSRESLPLSVLSANVDAGTSGTPGLHQTTSRIGANNERASIYSAAGVAPALQSERNSFYAKQSITGDGASVRSGFLGHGRADSITGSVAGVASPLASPKEAVADKGAVEEEMDENDEPKEKE